MTEFADDGYCFVCGPKNPLGLKLQFSFDGKTVRTEYTPPKEHQGYMNVVHGGIISTLLDEVMVKAAIETGSPAVTAQMDIRLKEAVKTGEKIIFEAEIVKETRKTMEASAKALVKGTVVAAATGKLIKIKINEVY